MAVLLATVSVPSLLCQLAFCSESAVRRSSTWLHSRQTRETQDPAILAETLKTRNHKVRLLTINAQPDVVNPKLASPKLNSRAKELSQQGRASSDFELLV